MTTPFLAARVLVTAGSAIVFALGAIHLAYTFWGDKLAPRDAAVRAAMEQGTMVLTRETTVWRAWVGFNASHSLCALLFGLVFGYLALAEPQVLFRSVFLQLLGVATLGALVVLAKVYWFSVPLVGVSVAFALFVVGVAAARL